jgi:tRNA 2-selenouridine synthase
MTNTDGPIDGNAENVAFHAHPHQLEVQDFSTYALVIDARSPREYNDDHIPGALNLPVVDDEEYAEVGTRHKDNKHAAYLIGVEYSLSNIAKQIKPLISKYQPTDRMLVYCFRGGKRSRLWADNLRTIGFTVDVLKGGWKNYRRWVMAGLETLPRIFDLRVLGGPTGCGKTRLLAALAENGEQVIDLEALANHRGSLIGALPGIQQPPQKLFDSFLLEKLRSFSPSKPVWLEAESKKIGNVQLPTALFEAMHRSQTIQLSAPMSERVKLWTQDYPHFATDPTNMVDKLKPLIPLIGKAEYEKWEMLASQGQIDELFERVMVKHYDPAYARSMHRNYGLNYMDGAIILESLEATPMLRLASELIHRYPMQSAEGC